MKISKFMKQAGLVLGAGALMGLAGCGSDGDPAIPPGEYVGAGVFGSDDSDGYLYLTVTVADDGTATGNMEIYVPTTGISSIPDGTETSVDLDGTTDGENFALSDGDVTATGSIGADGTLTAELSSSDATLGGFVALVPAVADDYAIACGSFGFGDAGTEGGAVFIASDDGDLLGVFGAEDFQGILQGTFDNGTTCGADSCNNEILGDIEGEFDGAPITFDLTVGPGLDMYETPGDTYLFAGMNFENATYSGGFNANTTMCFEEDICSTGITSAICSASNR